MPSKWYANFKSALDDIGVPAPESIFGSCAAATATIGALVKSLQFVAGANSTNMTLRALVAAAQGSSVDLATIMGAGTLADFLVVAGGLSASFYVGCLVGAAISATAATVWDWSDVVFSHAEATRNFKQISNTVSKYTNVPNLTCSAPPSVPNWSDPSEKPAFSPYPFSPAQQICRVPVAACNGGGIAGTTYCANWPTKPIN